MEHEVDRMVRLYEQGGLTRRQLVAHLGAFAAAMAAGGTAAAQDNAAAAGGAPTFQAARLDHIALSVTDVPRSRDWYVQHLGLQVTARDSASSSFLNIGSDFLALFRSSTPGLHHYSYEIANYDADEAMERIEAAGLEGRRSANRVYFPDPDGIVVQVSAG